jgi:hypothetical protein
MSQFTLISWVTLALACGTPGLLEAQDAATPPGQPVGLQTFAGQLADEESRVDTLLQLAAVLRSQQRIADGENIVLEQNIAQERAWLDRLQERRGAADPVSPVLDPAAWVIRQDLLRQGLPAGSLLAVSGPGLEHLLRAAFQRSDERLAATTLSELLWRLESEATLHWSALLEQSESNDDLRQGLLGAFPVASDTGHDNPAAVSEVSVEILLNAIASDTTLEGPPDRQRTEALRFRLLVDLPTQDQAARFVSVAFMRLGNLLDGLHEARYTRFAEGLLAVVGDLFEVDYATAAPVASWLVEQLPAISSTYARGFAEVDPRLNSTVAAAFDIARSLPSADSGPGQGDEVADAVAQLALLMPDIEYYFDLPIRDTIVVNVDACVGLMVQPQDGEVGAMSRDLFDDCIENLVRMAETDTRSPGLSGGLQGPFGPSQLRREVSVTPVQRINFGLGYLAERHAGVCTLPGQPLPNPLEWSSLATLLTWFAERMPVYFQTPENEARLERMRRIGSQLIEATASQAACYSDAGAAASDPVSRLLADYEATMRRLSESLRQAVAAFRASVLAPGADIALESSALQETLYRPENLLIGPCDPADVCEVSAALSANRALVGLFPEPFLIADQSGMGDVEICYDNVRWVDRRSEPVREDDENVANYFGRFAFDLKGRFRTGDEAREVFGFRFTSPDEYHYLFAAASEEVLQDACPMEWVGSRIVTPLPNRWGGIVPDRLTYLAASRMLPSRLLDLNWERGAEWRDWFTTGLGVEPLDIHSQGDIVPSVNEHLQSLFLREQSTIYRALLDGVGLPDDIQARRHLQELTTQKGLVRMLLVLLYPRSLIHEDAIRRGIAGQGGLLDEELLNRFRELDVPVNQIVDLGMARQESFRMAWREQPVAALRDGSVAAGVAHALFRLDQVYRNYFRAPAAGLQEQERPSPDASGAELNAPEPPASGDD